MESEEKKKKPRGLSLYAWEIVDRSLQELNSEEEKVMFLLARGYAPASICKKLNLKPTKFLDIINKNTGIIKQALDKQFEMFKLNILALNQKALKCIINDVKKNPTTARWWLENGDKIIASLKTRSLQLLEKLDAPVEKENKNQKINIKNFNVILKKQYLEDKNAN